MNKSFVLFLVIVVLMGCSNHNNTNYYYDVPIVESTELEQCDFTAECCISQWYKGKSKAVVFTWDDCTFGIDGVREVFDKYNLKTTFFVNTALIDDLYLKLRLFYKGTLDNVVRRALEEGHEIGSHTHDHVNLTNISLDEVEYQYIQSSNLIYEKYGFRPTTLSYPNSCYNAAIDSLTRKYFVDSRYSIKNDRDTTIRYMHIRSSYPFVYYKKNIDSFVESGADLYVYGGHQLEGGYEPLGGGENTLESILLYIINKYNSVCWITTFEDAIMYKIIREKVSFTNENGKIHINTSSIDGILENYTHPHCFLTLQFEGNFDFASEGLVDSYYDGQKSYVTIDLRRSNEVRYNIIDFNFHIQEPLRNLLK